MRVAHITDTHLLESDHHLRSGRHRFRMNFLSFGREKDAADRRYRLLRAMCQAVDAGADHIVMTGDMTEDGLPSQFESLADVLHESSISPDRITLVPGNHDLYTDDQAWNLALSGPLSPWAPTSQLGSLVIRGDLAVLPISTTFKQPYLFAGGRLGPFNARRIAWAGKQARELGCALVVGLHHQVFPHPVAVGTWWDGLRDHGVLTDLLRRNPELFVFHGHIHKEVTRAVPPHRHPQVFCARATVDSNVLYRLYDVSDRQVVPLTTERARVPVPASTDREFAIAAE
ncbi:MAG: metallophosphoesterase [Myxococcota bacterium]